MHEITLTIPVISKKPTPSALFNPLRQCDISGLFNEQMSMGGRSCSNSFLMENTGATNINNATDALKPQKAPTCYDSPDVKKHHSPL